MKTIRIGELNQMRMEHLREMPEEVLIASAKGESLAVLMPHSKFLKMVDDMRRLAEQLKEISSKHMQDILKDEKVGDGEVH